MLRRLSLQSLHIPLFALLVLGMALAASAQPAPDGPAGIKPHAGMLRYPDLSDKEIVFVYAGDLWVVAKEGGLARPLASPPGQEMFPKFNSDGSRIAFMGSYDGQRDLFTMPAAGGTPTRVTHHPDGEMLSDWTKSNVLLFATSAEAGLSRQTQIFTVGPEGGLPRKLPIPYGVNGALSSDGRMLAYTPHTIDNRTWKRYRGGMSTDIWLFDLNDRTSKKITDWEGTDSLPMWHGPTIYYMSDDGPEHRLNIWSYHSASGAREQITHFADYDVKWPSIGPDGEGPGEIIFQYGPSLMIVDLGSRESRAVEVTIPGDRPTIRPRTVDLANQVSGADLSPTGQRVVIEARGELFSVPASNGPTRSFNRTSGAAERDPAWSPDGKWIACFSDDTDEYELYVRPADGKGEARQLTKDSKTFYYMPQWSPDSKQIAFTDKAGKLYLIPSEGGTVETIDQDPMAQRVRVSWSGDSTWLAYTKALPNRNSAVWLYHLPTRAKHQVTSGMFNDSQPTFDRKGEYLVFASNRRFSSPIYEDIGTTFVYANTDQLFLVPLRKDVKLPWAAKSDEEPLKEEKPAESSPGDAPASPPAEGEKKKDEPPKPLVIDVEGFERRAMLLPVPPGSFGAIAVSHDGKLIYGRVPARGSDGNPSIKILDLTDDEKKEKTVLDGQMGFSISADGKKLLVGGRTMAIVQAAADQKMDKPVPLDGLKTTVDPRAEWQQVFNDAWRIQRDFFYDPNMHGVDWNAIRGQYARMLADCASRDDLTYVLGEMYAELNVGHAYVRPAPDGTEPGAPAGLLGADFELHEGAYRITRLVEGAPWDADARNPLCRPGVDVKPGEYLLAVNGIPVDTTKDPWAATQGLGGKVATLTVSEVPRPDDRAREVTVQLMASDRDLRYRAWIEHNRAYVAEKTAGRVGYIYVPNTGIDGQNDLFRQFYGQMDKAALIIDERWNGGGQIPTRFIELLNRPVTNYWARRDGMDWTWPPDSHQGPKCMLINGLAGSGGDAFPAYFRQAGLGKLIGTRTWGGLVGISGNPSLVDGGSVTAPTFAFYENDGTWGIEGHGVDPDIEILDDPARMTNGGDPQLDAAIEHILAEVERHPYKAPARPAYPDRRGFGIKPEDK
jgi:tricorn protease